MATIQAITTAFINYGVTLEIFHEKTGIFFRKIEGGYADFQTKVNKNNDTCLKQLCLGLNVRWMFYLFKRTLLVGINSCASERP